MRISDWSSDVCSSDLLAGAVRRDEVLQNIEAFTEVRGDRRLDDRAVRLGHQATHAGELTNLRLATTRTGVGNHAHGVERRLLDLLAVRADRRSRTNLRSEERMVGKGEISTGRVRWKRDQ